MTTIGNKEQFKFSKKTYSYDRTQTGLNRSSVSSFDDERECEKLFGTYRASSNSNSGSQSSSGCAGSTSNRSDGAANTKPSDNGINEETVKYIVDTYDEYVNGIKNEINEKCNVIEDLIKDKFREAGIDYNTFGVDIKKEFAGIFSKEIKF